MNLKDHLVWVLYQKIYPNSFFYFRPFKGEEVAHNFEPTYRNDSFHPLQIKRERKKKEKVGKCLEHV